MEEGDGSANLLRLNSILQHRIEELTEKLRSALQARKENLEEVEKLTAAKNAEYARLEEKYVNLFKDFDAQNALAAQHGVEMKKFVEENAIMARKLNAAVIEVGDLTGENKMLKLQCEDLSRLNEEMTTSHGLLRNQFDILGKQFLEQKASKLQSNAEFEQLLSENQALRADLGNYEVKLKHQLNTQQELNDLLQSMQQSAQSANEKLATEQQVVTAENKQLMVVVSKKEQEIQELQGKITALVAQKTDEQLNQSSIIKQFQIAESEWAAEKAKYRSSIADMNAQAASERQQLLAEAKNAISARDHAFLELTELSTQLSAAKEKSSDDAGIILLLRKQLSDSEIRQRELLVDTDSKLQISSAKVGELSEEVALLQAEVRELKASSSSLESRLLALSNACEESRELAEQRRQMLEKTNTRLQFLEDRHDLDAAKHDALLGEISDLEEKRANAVVHHDNEMLRVQCEMRVKFDEELESLRISYEKHQTDAVAAAVLREKHSSVEALSLEFQRTREELEGALKASKSVESNLQARNQELEKEVSMLRKKLVNERQVVAGLKAELATQATDFRGRLHDTEQKMGSNIENLKAQLRSAEDMRNLLDAASASSQSEVEKLQTEIKHLKDALEISEAARTNLEFQVETTQSQVKKSADVISALQREVADWNRKYSILLQDHEVEIQRLNKRNQVLQDTLSRLTHVSVSKRAPEHQQPGGGGGGNSSGGVRSTENTEANSPSWAHSPQRSVLKVKVSSSYQRGLSAPALMMSSVEKLKMESAAFSPQRRFADDADEESLGIQPIDTHRDAESLNRLQAHWEDYASKGKVRVVAAGDEGEPITAARAKTAPLLRSALADESMLDQFSSPPTNRALENDISAQATAPTDPTNETINRIQTAINQRRVQIQSRSKASRQAFALHPNGEHQSSQDTPSTSSSHVDIKTPRRTSGASEGQLSQNFIRKLRSTVEAGVGFEIPFSPAKHTKVCGVSETEDVKID